MNLTNKQIEQLAEQAGFESFEIGIFEGGTRELKEFAKLVLDFEEDIDLVEDKHIFTAYGKREDWE